MKKPKEQKKPGRAPSGWHAVAQNLAQEMVIKDKTIANLWDRIHALEARVTSVTEAGNKLAAASAELLRDSEMLERHRNDCAAFARIYGNALRDMIVMAWPVIAPPKPEPKPEQSHEREG